MIVLHRCKNHNESDKLEEKLKEMVISFTIEYHDLTEVGLPFIEEDGNEYREGDELKDWLRELEAELNWQRSLSGDGCYIDPKNGKIC